MSFGIFQPELDPIIGHPVSVEVNAFDPGLSVVFNRKIGRFEVYDKNAPGGPKWQLVMRIQNEDGSFRPLDSRVMESLRKARSRTWSQFIDQIEAQEAEGERRDRQQIHNDTAGMADDLKWINRRVVPTVSWDARSSAREAIRKEAGL